MAGHYHVYIRFGGQHCVRFLAHGRGIIATDGLELFEWVRNPANLARLRNGLKYTYEVHDKELRAFLKFKMSESQSYVARQLEIYENAEELLEDLEQERARFGLLRNGVDKLETIANATDIFTIPRTAARRRTDAPGWLYMLDMDEDTLEVYESKNYKSNEPRLTIETLQRRRPSAPPGYYIEMKISELQAMWKKEWIATHQKHATDLADLWELNEAQLQQVPHADNLPFAVLYGSAFGGNTADGMERRRPMRLTGARIQEVMAMVQRGRPSKLRKPARPAPRRRARHTRELASILSLREHLARDEMRKHRRR
ncbi:Uu.00g065200.m01.CDS01 [Anthostomella pinea]|uniref:Uu.00g065200.m01.CDS01 n=1 Tax=Anthostomella pinea TaxID=933095 RepID=A0AAI8YN75_9PEZI|nr:Uu.00g065200.m01.CDS01 [Anthostomella pinea]